MHASNPYNYNLPVAPEMFFGREADVAVLVTALTTTPGDSVALIGGRRMGKTSLLEAVQRALEGAATDLCLAPIFLDLTGEGLDSAAAFFGRVRELAQQALGGRIPDAPEALLSGGPPAPALRRCLETWSRAVLQHSGQRLRLVLLIDECEHIVNQPWAAELYGALRYLLVGQTTRATLKVVLTGAHRFASQVREHGSPLRNVLQYHTLRVLDEESARALLVRPTGGLVSECVMAAVLQESGRHPFLTQYLMHELWEDGIAHATPEGVQRIAARFVQVRHDFHDWADAWEAGDRAVYRALSQAGQPVTEGELRATLNPVPTTLPQALELLCYHGVAVQDADGRYCVTGDLFRRWFTAMYNGVTDSSPDDDDSSPVDTAALRASLLHLDDVQFDTLCMDHFPEVYDQFGRGMRRDEKMNLLLDYVRRNPEITVQLT